MISVDTKPEVGSVNVVSTENEGLSPEYWTERILERLISISDSADPLLKAQADAFRNSIAQVVLIYMKQAIASDRSTVAGLLEKQGHKDRANIMWRL